MIAYEARTDVLGQQLGEQHVAACRARRQADVPRRRLTHVVMQCHGGASRRCASSPSLPTDQEYRARRWRPNESFVKDSRATFESKKKKIPHRAGRCSIQSAST